VLLDPVVDHIGSQVEVEEEQDAALLVLVVLGMDHLMNLVDLMQELV